MAFHFKIVSYRLKKKDITKGTISLSSILSLLLCDIIGYIVTWNENEGLANNSKSMTVKGWATNKLQLTGLKKFTRYDITVRAFNSVSAGPSSASIIGTTKEGVPEAPPQNIACSEISSQIMKISWTPPPQNHHGGLILGYKVFYRPISSDISKYYMIYHNASQSVRRGIFTGASLSSKNFTIN